MCTFYQLSPTVCFPLPVRIKKASYTCKNGQDQKHWWQLMLERLWKKGTLLHCCWEYKLVQPLWMSVWQYLRKLGNNLSQDPVIPLLRIYPNDSQSCHKDMCSTMFIAALFVIERTWKQPKCPLTEEWIRKMWYIYTMEYDTAEKQNTISWILQENGWS